MATSLEFPPLLAGADLGAAQVKRIEELSRELSGRRKEALKLYEPQVVQKAFHRSMATERILRGGNRCQPAETIVWRPDGRLATLGELERGDCIWGVSRPKKKQQRKLVTVLFRRSFTEGTIRLVTKRGYVTEGTVDHPVWACPPAAPRYHNSVDPDFKKGEWVHLSDLQPGWYVRMAFGPHVDWEGVHDETAYFHGLMDGDGGLYGDYGVMKFFGHDQESLSTWVQAYLALHKVASRRFRRSEHGISVEWCNKEFKRNYEAWKPRWTVEELAGYICGFFDAEGCVTKDGKIVVVGTDLERGHKLQQWLLLFGVKSSYRIYPPQPKWKRPSPSFRLQISGGSVRRYACSIGFGERKKQQKLSAIVEQRGKLQPKGVWWDRIARIEPGCQKKIIGITTDKGTYIGDGVVSHNSGKSLAVFVETARCATGTDPYGKFPTDRPLLIWVICYEEGQIGRTAHRLLFRPGAFKIIRDKQDGHWRSFEPWNPEDNARAKQAKPAPPLIPERFVESISWENFGQRVFKVVRLNMGPGHPMNGTEIWAFASGAEPPMGDPVDWVHIDENLKYSRHVAEFQARLSDNKGRLGWSVFPYKSNSALVRMVKRAEEQVGLPNPDTVEFRLTFSANPHIDEAEKAKRRRTWSEEECRARDLGDFIDGALMYPEFFLEVHGIPRKAEGGLLEAALADKQIPADWTRYMIVDPGHTIGATLFAAVPPPEIFGNVVVAYDELYIQKCSAEKWGEAVARKVAGHRFRAFIIDDHGSRSHDTGSGKTIRAQYRDALKKRNIRSEITGHGFILGSDDVQARAMEVRTWLTARPDGGTRFRILRGRPGRNDVLPHMVDEFGNYEKRITFDEATDKPIPRQNHLMNCLEYLAAYNPGYYPPKRPRGDVPPVVVEYREWMEKIGKASGRGDSIHLGPGRG